MRVSTLATWAAAACALAASIICYQMMINHVTGSSGPAWFQLGCSNQAGQDSAGCERVMASPYSYFPPKRANAPPGTPHIPVAFIGLMYYSTLLAWVVGVGRPDYPKRWLHYAAFLLVTLGLGGSIYFLWIMSRVLSEWCPWCLATHILNGVIFICLLLMWPRRAPVPQVAVAVSETSPALPAPRQMGVVAHPSARVLALTLTGVVLLNYANAGMVGLKKWRKTADQTAEHFKSCLSIVERFRGDTEKLFRQWEQSKQYDLAVSDTEPVRPFGDSNASDRPSPAPLTIVVYSDFECPGCGRFAQFIEEHGAKLFSGKARLVFRHFPLDPTCNPLTQKQVHPRACEAAKMVEAARVLGGSAAFWKAHDFVFRNQESLKRGLLKAEDVAKASGVDPALLHERMFSSEVGMALQQHVESSKGVEVKATPAVYVDGRQVDNLVVIDPLFWERLAAWHREQSKATLPQGQ